MLRDVFARVADVSGAQARRWRACAPRWRRRRRARPKKRRAARQQQQQQLHPHPHPPHPSSHLRFRRRSWLFSTRTAPPSTRRARTTHTCITCASLIIIIFLFFSLFPCAAQACANADAWRAGCALLLGGVGAAPLPLRVNAPRLEALALAGAPLALCEGDDADDVAFAAGTEGALRLPPHTLTPTALGLAHCGPEALTWQWTREPADVAEAAVLVGTQRRYAPRGVDVGCVLRVRAAPPASAANDDASPDWARAAEAVVGPVACAPPRRDAWRRVAALGAKAASDVVRIMSYNTLADAYAHTWGALYPYLAPAHAAPEYRLPLALQDVLAAGADVIALQEVDARWYDRFWQPAMAAEGFWGRHTPKSGAGGEGVALFVRKASYDVIAVRDVDLRMSAAAAEGGGGGGDGADADADDDDDENESGTKVAAAAPSAAALPAPPPGLGALLAAQPGLATALRRVTTVAQLALLAPVRAPTDADANSHAGSQPPLPPPLLVANTHLFFHPRAGHVRLLQAHALLRAAATFRAELQSSQAAASADGSSSATASDAASEAALVLCGDLNAEPEDGPVRYLVEGTFGAGDAEWARGAAFAWGGASSRAAAAAAAREAADAAACGGGDAEAEAACVDDVAARACAAAAAERHASRRARLDAWHGGRAAAAAAGLLPGTAPARTCGLRIRPRKDATSSASSASAAAADDAPSADDVAAPLAGAYSSLAAHLRAGCTFKTCPSVAAWHLRRVAGLRPGLTLAPGGAGAAAALNALQALAAAVDADGDAAAAEQAALADVAAGDASHPAAARARDANGFRAAPLGVGAALAHPFALASGCGTPAWTNYVGGFAAVLDYVLYDKDKLTCVRWMPPPPLEAVTVTTALPNAQFPSDHLPQCCDLKRRET
jgi:2',5'-phosphodiesterase